MRITFDRGEYIRARAEALRKPAPAAKPPRAKGPRVKVYRTDRCTCGRIPTEGRKCDGCRAWNRAARARRVAAGLCAHAASHGPAVPGGKHCERCREFYRQQTAAAKARKKAAQ